MMSEREEGKNLFYLYWLLELAGASKQLAG